MKRERQKTCGFLEGKHSIAERGLSSVYRGLQFGYNKGDHATLRSDVGKVCRLSLSRIPKRTVKFPAIWITFKNNLWLIDNAGDGDCAFEIFGNICLLYLI